LISQTGSASTTDFLIVGGGIVGLAIARELRDRFGDAAITLIEKEDDFGRHASGRNSGVIHAGFYYTADSLKARLTRDGNRLLTEFCRERGLALNECGKVVVATRPQHLEGLDELERRAEANGVELRRIDPSELRDLEPRARTCERALFSPTTSSVDPVEVVGALVRDTRASGVTLQCNTAYTGFVNGLVNTTRGAISAGYVINAAGLYADRVARDFGFGHRFAILPFKGLYLYAEGLPTPPIRRHIYPVPDLEYPFLGVHFTVTVDGRAKIGPTAIPAFWRENYGGLHGFHWNEMSEVVRREMRLLVSNRFGFRTLAWRELPKALRSHLVRQSMGLVSDWPSGTQWSWGQPGIRAQLMDVEEGRLVMDFHMEGDERSMHVLNAVSPAFTCAFPFASLVTDRVEQATGGSVRPRPAEAVPAGGPPAGNGRVT
jgi:L-2-hydroxyglutarate oxidase